MATTIEHLDVAEATFRSAVARLEAHGYETSCLVRTLQAAGPGPDGSTARAAERS